MDKCCRTCRWFEFGKCYREELSNTMDIFDEYIYPLFEEGRVHGAIEENEIESNKAFEIADSLQTLLEDLSEMTAPFIPPEFDEFYCKYYE